MTEQTLIAIDPDMLDNIIRRLERIDARFDGVHMVKAQEWFTIKEYAEKVGKTPRTVRNWIDRGPVDTKMEGTVTLVRFNSIA